MTFYRKVENVNTPIDREENKKAHSEMENKRTVGPIKYGTPH